MKWTNNVNKYFKIMDLKTVGICFLFMMIRIESIFWLKAAQKKDYYCKPLSPILYYFLKMYKIFDKMFSFFFCLFNLKWVKFTEFARLLWPESSRIGMQHIRRVWINISWYYHLFRITSLDIIFCSGSVVLLVLLLLL